MKLVLRGAIGVNLQGQVAIGAKFRDGNTNLSKGARSQSNKNNREKDNDSNVKADQLNTPQIIAHPRSSKPFQIRKGDFGALRPRTGVYDKSIENGLSTDQ